MDFCGCRYGFCDFMGALDFRGFVVFQWNAAADIIKCCSWVYPSECCHAWLMPTPVGARHVFVYKHWFIFFIIQFYLLLKFTLTDGWKLQMKSQVSNHKLKEKIYKQPDTNTIIKHLCCIMAVYGILDYEQKTGKMDLGNSFLYCLTLG